MEGSVTTTPNVTGLAGDGLVTEGTAMPERLEVWELPAPESETLSVALREPTAAGVKVTFIKQNEPFARELPHEVVWEKSPAFAPVKEIEMLVTVEPLLLASVKTAGLSELGWPTTVVAKV
jgi:hypothetical protein